MNAMQKCVRCRLWLIGGAVVTWLISAIADIGRVSGVISTEGRILAFYATITGVILMFAAAVTAAYHLRFQADPHAAKEDILDVAVMLAAILLFTVNGIVRHNVEGSLLPLVLTVLGVAGLVAEFYVDWAADDSALRKKTPL